MSETKMSLSYDRETDVLSIAFRNDRKEGILMEKDGCRIRHHPETGDVTQVEVLAFSKRQEYELPIYLSSPPNTFNFDF